MNNEYVKSNLKDSIATLSILAVTAAAIVGAMVNSNDARADRPAVQHMETIVVTAPRVATVTLETIVVTASRETKILVASK
jgi:hypothetical protein